MNIKVCSKEKKLILCASLNFSKYKVRFDDLVEFHSKNHYDKSSKYFIYQ